MVDKNATHSSQGHWLLNQPVHTQKAMRLAFLAFIAVLFAWVRFLFGQPEGGGIEADFALLISGLAVALSMLLGTGLGLYQVLFLKQFRAGVISLLCGLAPLLELFLILKYLTLVRGLVLN